MGMAATPRKVTSIKEDEVIIVTVPASPIEKRIVIDAVKMWSNTVRIGIAAERGIDIADPVKVDHST